MQLMLQVEFAFVYTIFFGGGESAFFVRTASACFYIPSYENVFVKVISVNVTKGI